MAPANVQIIVAIDENNAIGNDNKLLFSSKEDLSFFKQTTLNHSIIMGRKTYESIGKVLPNRNNIIISSKLKRIKNATVATTIREAIDIATNTDESPFIIGGGEIYEQTFHLASTLYVSRYPLKAPKADTFFPEIRASIWNEELITTIKDDNNNPIIINKYTRIK